jgi:hypothetical protein
MLSPHSSFVLFRTTSNANHAFDTRFGVVSRRCPMKRSFVRHPACSRAAHTSAANNVGVSSLRGREIAKQPHRNAQHPAKPCENQNKLEQHHHNQPTISGETGRAVTRHSRPHPSLRPSANLDLEKSSLPAESLNPTSIHSVDCHVPQLRSREQKRVQAAWRLSSEG